jgi:ABC-type nitrate/sulfonate/bicarbonate transport system permease component
MSGRASEALSPAAATPTRPAASSWSGTALPRLVAGLAILLVWELVVRGFAPAYVAKPSGIAAVLPRVVADPAFWRATFTTLAAVAEGLAIAVVTGTVAGLAMGRSAVADRMLRHWVNGFYAVPMIVILPLVTLWFGYTGAARLATVVFAAFFSIVVNAGDGAQAVPRDFVEVARSFRSPRWRTIVEVVLPAATPYLLAGIRLAAGRALIGAVVAEFFTAIDGLGYFILFNSRTFRHNEAFVAVLLLAAFGVGIDALVNGGTRRFLPWYQREGKAG